MWECGARHEGNLVLENIVREDPDARSRVTNLGGVSVGIGAELRTGFQYGRTQDSPGTGIAPDTFFVKELKTQFWPVVNISAVLFNAFSRLSPRVCIT